MTSTHDDVAELLGAHALDAVSREEGESIEAHVSGCASCRAELDAHRAVAARLVDTLAPVAPPPYLWQQTLEATRSTSVATAGDVARTTAWHRPLMLAAVVLLVVSFGTAATRLIGRADRPASTTLALRAPDGKVMATVELSADEARVRNVSLPALDPSRTYQAWEITSGGARPIGTFGPQFGEASVDVDVDGDRVGVIAITAEPAGGSPAPSAPPLAATDS